MFSHTAVVSTRRCTRWLFIEGTIIIHKLIYCFSHLTFAALTLGVIILMCASLSGVRDRFEILGLAFICMLQLSHSIVHLTGAITTAYSSLVAIGALDDYIDVRTTI